MSQIYVLELENGKYYIGKTDNIERRYKEHKSGNGSEWTSLYKPKKILRIHQSTSEHDENNITKDYMKKYGIENVRGGAYSQVTLGANTYEFLERETRGNENKCFKCGSSEHFIRDCNYESEEEQIWACNSCNKEFTNLTRAVTHERKCSEKSSYEPTCYRCGRKGHYSTTCYAIMHISGDDLEDDSSCYDSE